MSFTSFDTGPMKGRLCKRSLVLLLTLFMYACSSGSDGTTAVFQLAVSIDGAGSGSVYSTPGGIDCGIDCAEDLQQNTVVVLTASPASGSTFAGWGGDCSGSEDCTLTMDATRTVTANFEEYRVDCSSYASYQAAGLMPEFTPAAVPTTTSVIMLHGKTASPLDAYLTTFYTALSDAGYDVVAPYLPWHDASWDGSMCEVMNYIDLLVQQEAARGQAVIIAGHSMGAAHALIYAVTSPATEVKAIVVLAPGHFPQLEMPLLTVYFPIVADSINSSIARAQSMVDSGIGDTSDTFETLFPDLNNPLLPISATANDYLSYHALDQYPDVNNVLPPIKLPVLWLAGADDELTDLYNMAILASRISSPISDYQLVPGDHISMVSSTGTSVSNWLSALGL
jgi:pimeloyl-ACP methyl ester carboxylesterase